MLEDWKGSEVCITYIISLHFLCNRYNIISLQDVDKHGSHTFLYSLSVNFYDFRFQWYWHLQEMEFRIFHSVIQLTTRDYTDALPRYIAGERRSMDRPFLTFIERERNRGDNTRLVLDIMLHPRNLLLVSLVCSIRSSSVTEHLRRKN